MTTPPTSLAIGPDVADVTRVGRLADLDLDARVQVEGLLHQFVRTERYGYHGDGSQIVDGHAPVQAAHHAVLLMNDAQSLHHAHAETERPQVRIQAEEIFGASVT